MSSRRDVINGTVRALSTLYPRTEAEATARALLADLEGCSLSHLLVNIGDECTADEAEIEALVAQLAEGRPLQYVLGHCDFCGLDFEVGEGVLIPRPETEELVAAVAERADDQSNILDLCTGSGCIAIALAKRLKNSAVTAVDISPKALEYARRNAERNGVKINFIEADIFENGLAAANRFDIIVSNPPYVPAADRESMHINVVGFEPHDALFVPDDDQLCFYRRIGELGRRLLREGGLLCFEIYELNAEPLAQLLNKLNYNDIKVVDDANLKPRIICCRR